MKKVIFILSLLILSNWVLLAQDQIFLQDGQKIPVKILDLTSVEIRYKLYHQTDTSTYYISPLAVEKVVYENGKVIVIEHEDFLKNKRVRPEKRNQLKTMFAKSHAIKLDVPGPLLIGHAAISYEHVLKKGKSLEIKVAYIGIGNRPTSRESYHTSKYTDDSGVDFTYGYVITNSFEKGFFIKAGPKFTLNTSTPFWGFYWKPELFYTQYGRDGMEHRYYHISEAHPEAFDYTVTYDFTSRTLGGLAKFGYQTVLGSRIVLNGYIGLGFEIPFDKLDETRSGIFPNPSAEWPRFQRIEYESGRQYSHIGDNNFALAAGLELGVVW